CAARYARRVRVLEMLVVVVVAREEHARRAVAQRVDRDARILDGLARDLERDPLLRIHPLGLTRRYVEVRGVKAADVLEEASPFRGDTAGRRGIRTVPRLAVPAIGRDLGDQVAPLEECLPQRLRVVDSAGEAQAHPDDRDGLGNAQRAVL